MRLRPATAADAVEALHRAAFGPEKGPEIADLTTAILADPTAAPTLSLVAEREGALLGHILFSTVPWERDRPRAALLAPLAVMPPAQGQGVGGRLIAEGLARCRHQGIALVFVLGHADYYSRFGSVPAGPLGFTAPYPMPEDHVGTWRVWELTPGALTSPHPVRCCAALDHPEHWVE